MINEKVSKKTVAFVVDWKQRSKKQQKKYFIFFPSAFLFVFVFCIIFSFVFQSRNYERIINQNMNYIQDNTIQGTNQIELRFENAKLQVCNMAHQYAVISELDENATIKDKLQLISDNNLFDRIAYIDLTGNDVSLEGGADISDRDYFKNALNGNSGWEYITQSKVTFKPSVVFYSPIYLNDNLIGVMAGFYEAERLDNIFSYHYFNYSPDSYLLLKDGTVVANSKDETVDRNFYSMMKEKEFTGENKFEDVVEAIKNVDRTSISFTFMHNGENTIGVIAQFKNSDWMVFSTLPNSVTQEMVNAATALGLKLLVAIILLFLVIIIFLIIFLNRENKHFDNEMIFASQNLEESFEHDQQQLKIVESLADVYSSVYFVNLQTKRYTKVKESDISGVQLPDVGDAVESFEYYISTFISNDDQKEVREFVFLDDVSKRINENGILNVEYLRKDGGWRRAIITAVEINENKDVKSFIFAVQEINFEKDKELLAKKALQEAYETAQIANKAKTKFLSNMSHDIRTPMNAIIGMTTIAVANIHNAEKVSDCLRKITSSSKHLLGLINEVLDMSKIESGKIDLSIENFNLSDLIDNLILINQPLIKEKNHDLKIVVKNFEHENVVGDSTRLQQVFTNILNNAIKYTPDHGKIEIIINEKNNNKTTTGWYEVIFKDNGIGMSEDFIKRLFEPFSRADDNRTTNIQGTGLGMPIAKNIINMMSGDIIVESEINKGSTFTVTFSLKLQEEKEIDYSKFVDLPVLIVDDDIVACESTCTIINSLSMNGEYVTSGKEAIDKVINHHKENNDYYAVIVDWKMPGMDGIETTRKIRKQVGKDILIIVLSAYDWSEIESEAKEAGVSVFLNKPLFKSKVIDLFDDLTKISESNYQSIEEYNTPETYRGVRVLLVEDNDLNREIAIELLNMIGVEVESAENGKICVDMVNNSKPGYYNLIFMDIQMPVMDGYSATKAIRELSHPDAKTIPIYAMTANAFTSDVRNALDVGMNGHISKPVDINRIIDVLNECFK